MLDRLISGKIAPNDANRGQLKWRKIGVRAYLARQWLPCGGTALKLSKTPVEWLNF